MANENILVVENDGIAAMDIQNQLGQAGYKVAGVCDNAEDAVKMTAELKVNLVIMDILLEGKSDGIEAARRIRLFYNTPVIFLTAHSDEATVARAILTEPYGYVPKPFNARTLRATIELALYRHKSECDRKMFASAGVGDKPETS
jgi:DNA-binding response OmpR family regulator